MASILVANRGEIAIRILSCLRERGDEAVALFSADDAEALHVRRADRAVALPGRGVAAYLDRAAVVEAARAAGATAVHPGYGFLSENADFARSVLEAGLQFVGPDPDHLEMFGDKVRARELAQACGVPVLRGTAVLDEAGARTFLSGLPEGRAIVLKAVHGGGGRGMRVVRSITDLPHAFARASAEAQAAFGSGALYAEEYLPEARHVEVQIAGDGERVIHLHERDCSLQRRHQKIVEIAPAPGLTAELRAPLHDAAVAMGKACRYKSLGTIEFLVARDGRFVFIEGNARLQVEHPVTEAVLGIDLVDLQLSLAEGKRLKDLGLNQAAVPSPRGHAVECRLMFETILPDCGVRPAQGMVSQCRLPSGPGVRVDSGVEAGVAVNPAFDSLAAKIVAHHPSPRLGEALARLRRALADTMIEGVETNRAWLLGLLGREELAGANFSTDFVGLVAEQLPFAHTAAIAGEEGVVVAPFPGHCLAFPVAPGDAVAAGATVAILEAMKMEHEVKAPVSGHIAALLAVPGSLVAEGAPLLRIALADVDSIGRASIAEDPARIRDDLAELFQRRAAGRDENRPEAVARRRKTGHRTARENIADLCDPGSFTEVGDLVVAAQRRRRSMADLVANTTGDGMVCGFGRVNGDLFPAERARVVAMSYDYMVLAGTQGHMNHRKKDRMFEIAARESLPVVLFAEGGGGRPGDTDAPGVAGLDCMAFHLFAKLSGKVPLVGITAGRCFAGNAILLGCCDAIIATRDSNIGVGGPAMIEGGGLGVFPPEAVGPITVQEPNGVVDLAVADEAEAVRVAKRYLAFFQGDLPAGEAPDPLPLRTIVPENRRRLYEMRKVIEGLVDVGSFLELRRAFGVGMITGLARIGGRAVGILANNPAHLSGAIDAPGADKAARFLQLCDAHGLPLVSLVDCPGIMVGPEIEKTALVRHACRMMVAGANLSVPLVSVVVRKGYGLGAQAMTGGSFKAPLGIAAWPTGEFGGMNLEGAVRLGYRRELEAIADPKEREEAYRRMVEEAYARGRAVNMASHFEIDTVIDPATTRAWLEAMLEAAGPRPRPAPRAFIDSW
ncbi:carboxyl transferase domain-containing protein [Thermaurantiacus sp.]